MMLSPTPLYFQLPENVREKALRENSAELGPDFLCFETFYQAVAASWPLDRNIIDIGGFIGLQGWLFRDFNRYICVDSYDFRSRGEGISSPRRCELPDNGLHVLSDGIDYLSNLLQFPVDLSEDVFICSAVPNTRLREMVSKMPNHVVWYPGEEIVASGSCAEDTITVFKHLEESNWRQDADRMVWNAIRLG